MKTYLILLVSLFFIQTIHAQSISGNMNASKSGTALRYGNVDIYKGDKLVASVLTDKLGNFSIALDTGMYVCVLNMAGYEPVKKNIHVTKDETANITMKEDAVAMERLKKKETPSSSIADGEMKAGALSKSVFPAKPYGRSEDYIKSIESSPAQTGGGGSGLLTAGEINDFSKWNLWQKYTGDELSTFQQQWKVGPQGRYVLQLESDKGLPVVDAKISLMDGSVNLFSARTDNTGKAECWLSLKAITIERPTKLLLQIDYQGQITTIKNPKSFAQGINFQRIQLNCQEIENVDIAFVVDATGSMGDEISFLQSEMNEIMFQAKQLSNKLNFRFANVYYRDFGDAYLTKSQDFTRILTESSAFINQQSAGGGGDYPEAMDVALDTAINRLTWSETARTRIIFLVLDAPPHTNDSTISNLERIMLKAAEKGIRIVPIAASGVDKSTEYLLRALAIGTNGTYTFLTNHSGIGNHHIEPTTDKYDVETLNKLMERIIKSYTFMPDCNEVLPDLNMNYPDSLVQTAMKDSLDSVRMNNQNSLISWSYYPNPTAGIVNILPNSDIKELYVTDLSGKVLQLVSDLKKDQRIQIDLSNYVTGIYLIRYLDDQDRWLTGQIVLQKNL